jgi:uncharacterized RmlC-like cupin family protein
MAKAGTGRVAPAKVKAAPPAAARKTGKAKAVEPKKKAAGKKSKGAPPKMAAAPKKGASARSLSVKSVAKGRTSATKKAVPAQKAAAAKRAVSSKKAVSAKAAAPVKSAAKTVAVKKAAPRRPATRIAVPTPAARRGRAPATTRKAPLRKLSGTATPQVFTVSHLNEADFKVDGLRAYAQYRDLGIAAATGGLCQAHVIRLIPPCTDEVRKRHLHKAELQLVYVLKGWIKNDFEGHGEQMMSAGSCWLQPSGIEHTVLDYSADCELLEVIAPADFSTEDVV